MSDPRARVAPLDAFLLDPAVLHCNHGSFGACPRAVLDAQRGWRDRMEAATMRFFVLEHGPALDGARHRLAAFVGADPEGLAFVPNATTGVVTALDGLIPAGADVVTTDHAYAACKNALDRLCAARGARVIVAHVDFPARDPGQVVSAVVDAVTPATRVVLIDHVTSPTALIFDVAAVVAALAPRGIEVVIDGAHAPGMLDLAIDRLGAAAYVGNLHKWVCAPKGAGFLSVRADLRARVRPLVTSHGAGLPEGHPDRFRAEHDWTGTHDPSAYLAVPAAIDEVARLGGGWPAVRAHLRAHALAMADAMADVLGAARPAPVAMLGSMVALPVTLPAGTSPRGFERRLLETGWEIAVVDWPPLAGTYLRVSAHLYNALDDAQRLAEHVRGLGVRGP